MKKKKITDIVILFVIAALLLFGIPRYVMERVIVDGISMENTLQNEDNILVEKVSRYFKALERFDIVVFYPDEETEEAGGKYYIKRIIGLPGETIQIKGSDIFINGELLSESFGAEDMEHAGIAGSPIELGEDEYFVLGDNRNHSTDSRSEVLGVVPLSRMQGKLVLRVFPFQKFGTVN